MNNNTNSYLSQVRQLRKVAISAIKMYPIDILQLKFINHGENTTYKIISKQGNFLLRIHRKNYHSKNAILEELSWIMHLSESTDFIQKPISSKNGLLVEEVTIGETLDTRLCSVLTWIDGNLKFRSLTQKSLFNTGLLAGKLHKNAIKQKVVHRNYWDSEGLLGKNASFGSLQSLRPEIKEAEYKILEACRKMTFSKIDYYNKNNPHKSSMIHADLHFGNIVWKKDEPIPIDFDDCGFGPHMYDLAVILKGFDNIFKHSHKKDQKPFVESLFEGYSTNQDLSKEDIDILPYFKITRSLVMLGWQYGRKDNPSIFKYFKKNLQFHLKYFEKVLNKGPDSLY
ncbi:MAG: phosphotransferase enzyme family protein [Marinicellaceae bacterium]